MSYRDLHREALRRAELMSRARTPLGHYWHQKQLVAALKAMIAETRDRHVVTTVTSSRLS